MTIILEKNDASTDGDTPGVLWLISVAVLGDFSSWAIWTLGACGISTILCSAQPLRFVATSVRVVRSMLTTARLGSLRSVWPDLLNYRPHTRLAVGARVALSSIEGSMIHLAFDAMRARQ
jgi:hypothetical protein